jgi:hypothetical protein
LFVEKRIGRVVAVVIAIVAATSTTTARASREGEPYWTDERQTDAVPAYGFCTNISYPAIARPHACMPGNPFPVPGSIHDDNAIRGELPRSPHHGSLWLIFYYKLVCLYSFMHDA